MTKYYALLTSQGAAKLANAAALGTKLQITQMAVGDGGGTLPTPNASQTALIAEKRRAAINALSVDAVNSSQIIAEQIIPEGDGGFWIREIGLFDAEGVMIAVANCPETYKPQLQEGSGRTQTVRMILIVNSTDAVTLKIDPSVVLATRKYADDKAIEVKAYSDSQLAQHIAAADPHKQYAPKASPALTGKPTAPTAAAGDSTKQLATTEFVQAVAAALVSGAPVTLDTLKKLALAVNNDPGFSATVADQLSKKQPLDATLTALGGKDVPGLLQYLGLQDLPGLDTSNNKWLWKLPNGTIFQLFKIGVANSTAASTARSTTINFPVAFPTECMGVLISKASYVNVLASAENSTRTATEVVTMPVGNAASVTSAVTLLAVGR